MESLKKCPFCGADAEIGKFGFEIEYTVGCSICPAWMEGFKAIEDAVKAWNLRSNGVANTDFNPTRNSNSSQVKS